LSKTASATKPSAVINLVIVNPLPEANREMVGRAEYGRFARVNFILPQGAARGHA
jgi:hypothetical protein